MKPFRGSTLIKLDMSGRLKLPPNVVADFKSVNDTGDVVLKYLSEGAITILPASPDEQTAPPKIKSQEFFNDNLRRMRLRSDMYFTEEDTISPQGRITIPEKFRDYLGLKGGEDIAIIGMLYGYEIWKKETLDEEMNRQHKQERDQYERDRCQFEQKRDKITE